MAGSAIGIPGGQAAPRSNDVVMQEIRQSQKKLRAAKGRHDQSTVKYLQAHISLLRKELEKANPDGCRD